ncbi:MAG: methyltransferase domain-containing protein, partial [Candidatus Limnocylindrales bacterium]
RHRGGARRGRRRRSPHDDGAFDVVVSRNGLMFFSDPDAAFANLARSLRREAGSSSPPRRRSTATRGSWSQGQPPPHTSAYRRASHPANLAPRPGRPIVDRAAAETGALHGGRDRGVDHVHPHRRRRRGRHYVHPLDADGPRTAS